MCVGGYSICCISFLRFKTGKRLADKWTETDLGSGTQRRVSRSEPGLHRSKEFGALGVQVKSCRSVVGIDSKLPSIYIKVLTCAGVCVMFCVNQAG